MTAGGPLFWIVAGASGVAGAFAGDAVADLGLRRVLLLTTLALAVATAILPAAPASWPAIVTSAVLFGAAFIAVTGMLGVWSINVFYDRPSAGFGATFFLISAGQLVGPTAFALVSGRFGLASAFYAAAALTAAAAAIGPLADLRSMAPGDNDVWDQETDGR